MPEVDFDEDLQPHRERQEKAKSTNANCLGQKPKASHTIPFKQNTDTRSGVSEMPKEAHKNT